MTVAYLFIFILFYLCPCICVKFSINGTSSAPVANVVQPPAPVAAPAPAPKETAPKATSPSSKEENIAKLKSMTSDFWSQM